jgi:hypothetical protein
LEAEAATMNLALLKSFIPEQVIKRDIDVVQCAMLFYRLEKKQNLVVSILQRQFGIPSDPHIFVDLSTSPKVAGAGALSQNSVIDARLVAYRVCHHNRKLLVFAYWVTVTD